MKIKNSHILTKFGRSAWLILFFLMVSTPGAFSFIKLPFLIAVTALCTIAWVRGHETRIHPETMLLLVVILAYNCFGMIKGAVAGAPGAIRVASVFLVWPLLFTFVGSYLSSSSLRSSLRVLCAAGVFIGFFGLAYVIHVWGAITVLEPLFWLDFKQSSSVFASGVKVSFVGMTSLAFLLPFIMAMLFYSSDHSVLSGRQLMIALVVCGSFALVSGRRALVLSLLLSPVLVFFAHFFLGLQQRDTMKAHSNWKLAVAAFGIIAASALLLFGTSFFAHVLALFTHIFETQSDGSAGDVRVDQIWQLVENWRVVPIFGAGLGAVADGPLRSGDMPWGYELTYFALLFHQGVVGIALYAAGIMWVLMRAREACRGNWEHSRLLAAMVVGMMGFLAASGTNPYLTTFDCLWTLFFPVALVNMYLVKRDHFGIIINRAV